MSTARRTSRRRTSRRRSLDHPVVAAALSAVCVVVVAARAVTGQAASWLDVVAVGVAAAVLVLAVMLPTSRPRRRGASILPAAVRQRQRVATEVLGGGHPAWQAPGRSVVRAPHGYPSGDTPTDGILAPPAALRPHPQAADPFRLAETEPLLHAPPAQSDPYDVLHRERAPRKPGPAGRQRMRLAVAEELLEAAGLAADYRDMVSAVEQEPEAEQAG